MFVQSVKRSVLAALALTLLALPAPAAPIIKSGTTALINDKYLLDDVDGVLVINVKQIMETPAYKKGFHKQLSDLLARPEVAPYLKDAGVDPLKDVERVVLCMGRSCFQTEVVGRPVDDGPFLLFHGKFDVAKVKAKLAALVKQHPDVVSESDGPGAEKIYRIGPQHGPYVALLDKNTAVLAGMKSHVVDALNKSSGKKTTKFTHKDVPNLLKKLKSDVAIQGFALEQMVVNTRYERADNGMGKGVLKTKLVTLGDNGFKEATLSVTIKDEAIGSCIWHIKDKAKAAKFTAEFTQGLEEAGKFIREQAGSMPRFGPLSRFLDAIALKNTAATFTIEGKADPDVVRGLFMSVIGEVGP
jgi:hypothetical protein